MVMAPESFKDQQISKEKFVIWSSPNIWTKLQKMGIGPESTPDNLLKIVNSAYYNREKRKPRKEKVRKGGRPRFWWQLYGR
jgi:hypothetical protein